jgi:hypothetical protein
VNCDARHGRGRDAERGRWREEEEVRAGEEEARGGGGGVFKNGAASREREEASRQAVTTEEASTSQPARPGWEIPVSLGSLPHLYPGRSGWPGTIIRRGLQLLSFLRICVPCGLWCTYFFLSIPASGYTPHSL